MSIESRMMEVIRTWGGNITVTKDGYNGYFGIIGDRWNNSAIYLGPAETREELIRNGYATIYQKMWKEVNWVINE
jgi:hypothetical protein